MRYCSGNNFTTKSSSGKGSANFDYAGSIPPELFLRQFLNMEGNKILKADGSLDVDMINKLPLEEWMSVMGNLTEE